jgi:hypothetical protein
VLSKPRESSPRETTTALSATKKNVRAQNEQELPHSKSSRLSAKRKVYKFIYKKTKKKEVKTMKKFLSITLAALMLASILCLPVFAADASADVYVTIADKDGKLALVQEKITVSDKDGDGKLTIDEALFAAHEAKYQGGAAAGYATSDSQWGLSLSKLWGTENGGSYGYYVNNASAMGLTDEVKSGDYINAFVYTDLVAWSDSYCFFDVYTASAKANGEITLTLSAAGYDANWAPVTLPVANAVITVDGVATEYKTDAEGKVTLKLSEAGEYVISATSAEATLVPPAVVVTVEASSPATGDSAVAIIAILLSVSALGAFVATRKRNEI